MYMLTSEFSFIEQKEVLAKQRLKEKDNLQLFREKVRGLLKFLLL